MCRDDDWIYEEDDRYERDAGIAAATLYYFGAWLTTRKEVAGPFSANHEAGQMAEPVAKFCGDHGILVEPDMDGWPFRKDVSA